MRTVRRLYFYAVAFISLEVVVWGLINLTRSAVVPRYSSGGSVLQLALALALIFVGVPVFGLHWWLAERGAHKDMEERASGVRAIFLYGVLLATLIPITQNALALLDRLLLQFFGLPTYQAMFGATQTWSDNLLAMLMNGLVAAYFISVLRADWKVVEPKDTLVEVRRIYRYVWVLYPLVMVVAAVQQLLWFALGFASATFGLAYRMSGFNGMVLALVGVPVWVFAWLTVQKSLAEKAEAESLLRLGILYFLALAGVITVLISGGIVIDLVLRGILGEQMAFVDFIRQINGPLSIGMPLGGVWAYFGYWLGRTMKEVPDAPRRTGMRRLYYYILAAIGVGATFIGLVMLFSFVVDGLFGSMVWADTLRPRLAAALATLAAGFPLWLLAWWPMQTEALATGDAGDHARRSLVRRVFLYLALFASVVGGMISAVDLFYNLLRAVLGSMPAAFPQHVLKTLEVLFLFVLLGVYHGLTMRRDGKKASEALAAKHAAFPVLVFDPDDGSFGQIILAALHKQTPLLPAVIQAASQPVGKDATPKAIILPGDLAVNPPEALRKWLGKFGGNRLVVPRTSQGWLWVGGTDKSQNTAAGQVAQVVRQLAEGQEVRMQGTSPGYKIAAYILAGLIGLPILFALINLVAFLFNY